MGVILAIRRSYRHFLPAAFWSPRKFIRRWYMSLVFYVVGLLTGISIHVDDPRRVTYVSIAAFAILLLLKWWSGISERQPEA